jgi:flagella basal body P-ring formation protein FlgA
MMAVWRPRCAALMIATAIIAPSRAETAGAARIEAADLRSLQQQLVELADRWLAGAGLSVDGRGARLSVDGTFAGGSFDIKPLWSAGVVPELPLSFELHDVLASADVRKPFRVTLAAALMRETAVTRRRVRKGSPLTCDDIASARLPLRVQRRRPLSLPCNLAQRVVALRELGAGESVDDSDAGEVSGVLAGEPVDVRVHAGTIAITTSGTALSDAQPGETAQVQLRHPTRTLRSQVVGRSVVELQEQSQ